MKLCKQQQYLLPHNFKTALVYWSNFNILTCNLSSLLLIMLRTDKELALFILQTTKVNPWNTGASKQFWSYHLIHLCLSNGHLTGTQVLSAICQLTCIPPHQAKSWLFWVGIYMKWANLFFKVQNNVTSSNWQTWALQFKIAKWW